MDMINLLKPYIENLNKAIFYVDYISGKEVITYSNLFYFNWCTYSVATTTINWFMNNLGYTFGILYNDDTSSLSLANLYENEINYLQGYLKFKFKVNSHEKINYVPVAKKICNLVENDIILISTMDIYDYKDLFASLEGQCESHIHFNIYIHSMSVDIDIFSNIFSWYISTPFNFDDLSEDSKKLLNKVELLYNINATINPFFYYTYLSIQFLRISEKENVTPYNLLKGYLYEGYELSYPSGEKITLERYNSFPNYLNIYKREKDKYILMYASNNYFANFLHIPRDNLVCFTDKEHTVYKIGIIAIKYLITNRIDEIYSAASTALNKFFFNVIIDDKSIGYELYVISEYDQDLTNALKYFKTKGIEHIIGGHSVDSIKNSISLLKENNQLLYVPYSLSGNICDSHVIFTAVVPNQYITSLYTYISQYSDCTHILYEETYPYLSKIVEIFVYLSQNSLEVDEFKINFNNLQELSDKINSFKSDECSILFVSSTKDGILKYVINELITLKYTENERMTFIIQPRENQILEIDSVYTDGLYIVTSYDVNSKEEANIEFKNALYKYATISIPTSFLSDAYIAVQLIYTAAININSFDPSKTINYLYGKNIESPSGTVVLDESNYLYRKTYISLVKDNKINSIVSHVIHIKPEPYYLTLPDSSMCIVNCGDNCEYLNPVTRIKVLLLYDDILYPNIDIIFYYFIMYFNSEKIIINPSNYLQNYVIKISSDEDCEDFIKNYEDIDKYSAIFLSISYSCKIKFNISPKFSEKILFAIHYNENTGCYKNIVSHGIKWSESMAYQLQVLIAEAHLNDIVFLTQKSNKDAYDLGTLLYNSYGFENFQYYIIDEIPEIDNIINKMLEIKSETIILVFDLDDIYVQSLINNSKWELLKEKISSYFSLLPITKLYNFTPFFYISLDDPEYAFFHSLLQDSILNYDDDDVIPDYTVSMFRIVYLLFI